MVAALPAGDAERPQRTDRDAVRVAVPPAGGVQDNLTEPSLPGRDRQPQHPGRDTGRRRPRVTYQGPDLAPPGVGDGEDQRHRFTQPRLRRAGPGELKRAHTAGEHDVHDHREHERCVDQQQGRPRGRG